MNKNKLTKKKINRIRHKFFIMKKKLLFLLSFFITSCVPLQYCQLYQVNPISVIQVKEDALTYEDDNCLVYYNFWKEYGEIGFVFYNKTSDYLYLHLNQCCYVINGYAYDYYQDGNPLIIIPPQTRKTITGFSIKNNIYRSCDLLLNPTKKDPNYLTFTKDNTPLFFGNLITYSLGDSKSLIRVNNEFYVSKITNFDNITHYVDDVICGKKQNYRVKVFKESGPDQFYIWYSANYYKY